MRQIIRFVALLPFILMCSAGQALEFEVASVRPNKSGTLQTNIEMLPDGVDFVNLPLRAIIQFAFGINQPSKLIGVPDWAASERFDVRARAAGPVSAEDRRKMLQSLLADRFKLVAQMEKREVQVLALMLARNDGKLGPELVPSPGCISPGEAASQPQAPVCGLKGGGAGKLILTGMPMQQFTSILGVVLSRTVVDKTGLTGSYDLSLTFAPEQPLPANIPIAPADPNAPSIYTAVREQLGLKLEAQRDQEEVLVIDSVMRQPSEN